MKKILITGANSYVGTSFAKWVNQWPDKYKVDMLSVRGEAWKGKNFSYYDVIYHVAGIAHVDIKNVDKKTENLYYMINRDLTIEIAKKAKLEGVKQFIFMSSIIVYGDCNPVGTKKIITNKTEPNPSNFYGDSKLQAENGLKLLQSDKFKIVILRSPMIYGKDSKGNYLRLSNIAKLLPVFPDIDNERSMIFILNLCEFVRNIIDYNKSGIFFPQNKEYVKVSMMVKEISKVNGKKMKLTKIFNPLIIRLSFNSNFIKKVFGNLVYERNESQSLLEKNFYEYKETIKMSER